MIIKIIISLSVSIFNILQAAHALETHSERIKTEYPQLITFLGKSHFKLPNQATSDLKATYTITKAGTYVLTDDIPSSSESGAVILITAHNVILDFAGKNINLVSGNGQLINGITIASGVNNIIIKNGIINLISGSGIYISAGCTNILIEDMIISECTTSGISSIGLSNNPVLNVKIKQCTAQLCNGKNNDTYGLHITYTHFFIAEQCNFINQKTSQSAKNVFDIYALNCKNGTFLECSSKGASASLISVGFYGSNCTCLLFKKCMALLTNSSATSNFGKAYGFYNISCSSSIFEECLATNITSYALSIGFYLQNSSHCSFLKCSSINNMITGSSGTNGSYGFLCDTTLCEGNTFNNCFASGNKGNTENISKGCGFCIDNSQGCTITNSVSQANDGASGIGIGIELRSGASRSFISYNTITSNTSSVLGKAYGIWDQANPSKNLLLSSITFANRDETTNPIDQNYITTYNLSDSTETTTKNNFKKIDKSTYQNIGITP